MIIQPFILHILHPNIHQQQQLLVRTNERMTHITNEQLARAHMIHPLNLHIQIQSVLDLVMPINASK